MKELLLIAFTGVVLVPLFWHTTSNFSQAPLEGINKEQYQEVINTELNWKIDEENKHQEEIALQSIYDTLEKYSTKIETWDLIPCLSIWEEVNKMPDPVFTENQEQKNKINNFYTTLSKSCRALKSKDIQKRQAKIEERRLKEVEEKKSENKLILEKVPTSQQRRFWNTCVIDSLDLIIKYQYWKSLDKDKIYHKIGKSIWDLWYSGLFTIWKNGGTFTPIHKNTLGLDKVTNTFFNLSTLEKNPREKSTYDIVDEWRDWEKLEEDTNLKTGLSPSIWYLKNILNLHQAVLMEVPMSLLYPNDSKWTNSNIFHAISVYQYDEETNEVIYSNTLTNKLERINLDKFKYDENYLNYPFRYITSFDPVKYTYFKN